ncbi:hypothetical protein [Candidatus Nitrosocosmicus hydrocola]|nr:hypothetical protein [Candidatus Nitrosocosmicus hydrocola]
MSQGIGCGDDRKTNQPFLIITTNCINEIKPKKIKVEVEPNVKVE